MRRANPQKIRRTFFLLVIIGLVGVLLDLRMTWRPRHPVWVARDIYPIKKASLAFHTLAGSAQIEIPGASVLYAKNVNQERPIASTTKIMTAYLVLKDSSKVPLDRVITVTAADTANYKNGLLKADSEVPLHTGQKTTVRDLLWALMLPSADDAAWSLARVVSRHASRFVALMNKEATQLGMRRTHYLDSDGVNYHAVSTAKDLLKVTTVALKNREFRIFVGTLTRHTLSFGVLTNLNQLLGSYPGAFGVKTGWTPSAGSCLVFAARRTLGGHRLTLYGVVLGEPGFRRMFVDVRGLLDTGFQLPYQTLIRRDGVVAKIRVVGAGNPHSINLSVREDLGHFQTGGDAKVEWQWSRLHSSWLAGAVMGRCRLIYGGSHRQGPWVDIVADQGFTRPWWAIL